MVLIRNINFGCREEVKKHGLLQVQQWEAFFPLLLLPGPSALPLSFLVTVPGMGAEGPCLPAGMFC